jgi:uncharacterized membrane protein YhaH (DUF805 family)
VHPPERWFLVHGRIRRSTWIARVFGVGFALFLSLFGVIALLPREADAARPIVGLVAGASVLGFLAFRIVQDVKRLHDLGRSGLWVLCAFIPAVNFFYVVFLIFADGQPFTNEFGPDPKGRGGASDIDSIADVFR